MIPYRSDSLRPNGLTLGVRWLVLWVFVVGAIMSSVGSTSSHGLAAMAATLHTTAFTDDESHEHAHMDADLAVVNHSAGADHPHHGADHSHDKAHALPAAWSTTAMPLPSWFVLVRPWTEMIQASRLERPPRD